MKINSEISFGSRKEKNSIGKFNVLHVNKVSWKKIAIGTERTSEIRRGVTRDSWDEHGKSRIHVRSVTKVFGRLYLRRTKYTW